MHTIKTATRYQCEICGKEYLKPKKAAACEEKGMFEPRYHFGDRVMVRDGKARTLCIITQTGYEREHYELSCYVVFRIDGYSWEDGSYREVPTRNILGIAEAKNKIRLPRKPIKIRKVSEFWQAWDETPQKTAEVRRIIGHDPIDQYAV